MLIVFLCVTLVGMICGLIFLHWFGLAALSFALTVGVLVLAEWDRMLLPKWLAFLTALQGGYLAGAALRTGLRRDTKTASPAAPGADGVARWGAGTIFDKPVRSYVERILRLEQKQDELSTAIRAIYAEAQNDGLDRTTLRQLVSYIGKKERDADSLAEREDMFDLYLAAYEGRHLGEADAPLVIMDDTSLRATRAEAGEDVPHASAAPSFAGERILILEDEPTVATHHVSEVVAASGDPVGPASSVKDAIRLIEGGKIDGAIVDMRLVKEAASGFESELTERSIPFVILSGVEMSQQQQRQPSDVPDSWHPVTASDPVSALAEQLRKAARKA